MEHMANRIKDDETQKADEILRTLIVEDNPLDVKLMAAMLERSGYHLEYKSVDTPESFQEQINEGNYEVVISDYNLHSWTAIDALDIVKKSGKDIPFIVVTGTLG